jgi:hypothetical protein
MRLRPWDKRHPNVALMYDDDQTPRCVCCGCDELKEMTAASYTAASVFPSFRCKNCGKVMRSRKRDKRPQELYANSQ